MSLLEPDIEELKVTIERVCRAYGCTNRFEWVDSGRGGRVKQYCSDTCKKRASRGGGSGSALSKVSHLQSEWEKLMREINRLQRLQDDMAVQQNVITVAMDVARREADYDRLKEVMEREEEQKQWLKR